MLRQKSLPANIFFNGKLLPDVRQKLMQIATDFWKSLGLEELGAKLIDITLTGSQLTPFRTNYSDLDCHLLVDFSELDADDELLKKIGKLSKYRWSHIHDIKIKGMPLELYLQDISEPHYSAAVYSVSDDKWIKTYKSIFPQPDRDLIIRKSRWFKRLILLLEREYAKGEDISKAAEDTKNYLLRMRKTGLEQIGTMSNENLIFKVLRQGKVLDRLQNLIDKSYDRQFNDNGDYDDFLENYNDYLQNLQQHKK